MSEQIDWTDKKHRLKLFTAAYEKGLAKGFKIGLEHSMSVRRHWKSNEADGVDALRTAIRQELDKLG